MGFPMAGHLAQAWQKAGHQVQVYNRSQHKAEDWIKKYAGSLAETPKRAAEDADFVMACLGNDDDVRQVMYGDQGAIAGLKPGSILIDHTTTSANLAEELATATRQKKAWFLDAPVSGGQAGAEKGQLTIMVGGEPAVFEKATPILEVYAQQVVLIGPTGHGQMAKMVNQICLVGLVQSLAEALSFAQKSKLDTDKVLQAISKGASQSWQMENRAATMLKREFDFGFAVRWVRKDLKICLEQADKVQASLPITALVDQFYAKIEAADKKHWDTSSLISLLD